MHDDEIDLRLARLEARAPGPSAPRVSSRWFAPRLLGGSLVAPVVALLVAGTVLGGSVVGVATWSSNGVSGYEGAENPEQPLHGARLECLTPTAAAAYLQARGITDVVWQVEGGTATRPASIQVRTPPIHGWVVPGAFIGSTLYMIIDQRTREPAGDCPRETMP